jgi:hypothetical protein
VWHGYLEGSVGIIALGHWSRFGLAVATVTDRNENRRNAGKSQDFDIRILMRFEF